jgi:Protein of unknown function (DUF2971)
MLLYKYKGLDDLWQIIDIIMYQRIWCAQWDTLNDPLEGRYEVFFVDPSSNFTSLVNKRRDEWRICSLSEDLHNFLLWSHYGAGHRGIAIEIDIPEDTPELVKVLYIPFSPMFTDANQSNTDQRGLFTNKTQEWQYEKEYRILNKQNFFKLPNPIKRIFLGPKVPIDRIRALREILPDTVELVEMELDITQGRVVKKPMKIYTNEYQA